MSDVARRPRVFVLAAFLVAACAGTVAGPSASPDATSVPTPTSLPTPTAEPTAAPTASPRPTPIPILAGEPWLLHDKYLNARAKGVLLVRPDGTDDHRILTDVQSDLRAMTWSSDGSRIAFVYWGPGGAKDGEIWTAAADGGSAAKLLDGSPDCSGAFYPAWSPDDRRLAFVCYTSDGNGSLAVYDLETKAIAHLVRLSWPEVFDNPPRWSPDGATIAFDILHWDPTNEFLDGSLLATIRSTGGTATRLTSFDSFAAYPDWHPDGNELVFNTYDQGNMVNVRHASNLYAIAVDGQEIRKITTVSKDGSYRITQPRWDPSGERIWVTIWQPDSGITIGWVDPATGAVTDLKITGARPQPRPLR